MHFLHVLTLTGSILAAAAEPAPSAVVIPWSAVLAHRMVHRAFGQVPTELKSTLREFRQASQLHALVLVLGRYGRNAGPLVEVCLDVDTDSKVDRLARLVLCNERLAVSLR